jgi:hypothetical protein
MLKISIKKLHYINYGSINKNNGFLCPQANPGGIFKIFTTGKYTF